MPTEIIKKRFTVDEYYRMVEVGILQPKERVELIDGEIVEMSPIGHRHGVRVIRVNTLFIKAFGDRAVVGVQTSIRLNDWTEPEPDLVVFKHRSDFYAGKKPTPQDILFVMEVADTSLRYDRNVKVPLFAAAGIPEVWVEDAKNDVLYVYRDPRGGTYAVTIEAQRGDFVSPIAFPDIQFSIDHLLGEAITE
jgi:Uma2 family endonuclease